MVDAARQMLDELMGRNRNLHPSEAGQAVNWEDPEVSQWVTLYTHRFNYSPCDIIEIFGMRCIFVF